MNTLIYVGLGVGLALLAGLIASVIWLSKSRKGQVEAEQESKALRAGKDLRRAADEIMAEPVADELIWFDRTLKRVRDKTNRKS